MKKILFIQTAFIGDVILATALIEKWHTHFPNDQLDILVRKGNESLLQNHPFIHGVLVWNKKESKYKHLFRLLKSVRSNQYDFVINLQRFAASGILTAFSRGKIKIGFEKNPFSFMFTEKYPHHIGNGKHEVQRNQLLIEKYTDSKASNPKLYPAEGQKNKIKSLHITKPYVVVAPASVWFTKQLPSHKFVELINGFSSQLTVCFIGAPSDYDFIETIKNQVQNKVEMRNLSRDLSLLDSAELMAGAKMNYVNDSAPLHLCSAMNAPVTAFFCSTVPEFGFGPLSAESVIKQVKEPLNCRPCGLHGFNSCPKGHFKCGNDINVTNL